jgi:hypothetical protein
MVSSGPISLAGNATTGGLNQSVNIELNRSATATINMNESAVRTLAAVPSGAISMSNFYGKSNRVIASVVIAANTANYTVNTAKVTGYVAGSTDLTLTINSGIFVSSGSTGSYAMTVDTSWAAGDTISIINNGTIVGRGGNGGQGAVSTGGNGNAGSSGGPALIVNRAVTFNNTNGRIAGGGGGGGGGTNGQYTQTFGKSSTTFFFGGGGGGGGIGDSSGGAGGSGGGGNPGSGGTLTAAGAGGATIPLPERPSGAGGAGGGYGSGGAAGQFTGGGSAGGGGAAGACIAGNANITYAGTGIRNGSIS